MAFALLNRKLHLENSFVVSLACADVPAGVGDDPDGGEDVDVVDGRLLRLRHVQDDEEDEDLIGSVAGRTHAESDKHSK